MHRLIILCTRYSYIFVCDTQQCGTLVVIRKIIIRWNWMSDQIEWKPRTNKIYRIASSSCACRAGFTFHFWYILAVCVSLFLARALFRLSHRTEAKKQKQSTRQKFTQLKLWHGRKFKHISFIVRAKQMDCTKKMCRSSVYRCRACAHVYFHFVSLIFSLDHLSRN